MLYTGHIFYILQHHFTKWSATVFAQILDLLQTNLEASID